MLEINAPLVSILCDWSSIDQPIDINCRHSVDKLDFHTYVGFDILWRTYVAVSVQLSKDEFPPLVHLLFFDNIQS